MRFLRYAAITGAMLLGAMGSAQWSLSSSSMHYYATMKTVLMIEDVEAGVNDWDLAIPNWFWVEGDPTQAPNWGAYFAGLCTNTWVVEDEFQTTNQDGDTIYVDDYAHERYGHETWTRENPAEAARRDIKRSTLPANEFPGQPGYHVTDYYEVRITPFSGGGSGGGN